MPDSPGIRTCRPFRRGPRPALQGPRPESMLAAALLLILRKLDEPSRGLSQPGQGFRASHGDRPFARPDHVRAFSQVCRASSRARWIPATVLTAMW